MEEQGKREDKIVHETLLTRRLTDEVMEQIFILVIYILSFFLVLFLFLGWQGVLVNVSYGFLFLFYHVI